MRFCKPPLYTLLCSGYVETLVAQQHCGECVIRFGHKKYSVMLSLVAQRLLEKQGWVGKIHQGLVGN